MPDICCRKTIETEVTNIYTQKRKGHASSVRALEWVVESIYLRIELGFNYVSAIIFFSTPKTSDSPISGLLLPCA